MSVPYLHVYSPSTPHDPAFIAGNREGLRALIDLLERVIGQIQTGQPEGADESLTYVADGEGAATYAMCLTDKGMEELAVPYTSADDDDGWARETRPEARWPAEIIRDKKRAPRPTPTREVF